MEAVTQGNGATQPAMRPAAKPIEKISIIVSKGSLDMAYPAFILANAARMEGIEATIFFTFWGLDVVTKEKLDDLHVQLVGNTSMPFPTVLAGLPGMEHLATRMMKKEMEKLDIPPVGEFLTILKDSGCELYACKLAMEMFKLDREDLVPEIQGVLTAGEFFEKSAGAQLLFI